LVELSGCLALLQEIGKPAASLFHGVDGPLSITDPLSCLSQRLQPNLDLMAVRAGLYRRWQRVTASISSD